MRTEKQSKRVFDIASKPGLRVWLAFFLNNAKLEKVVKPRYTYT